MTRTSRTLATLTSAFLLLPAGGAAAQEPSPQPTPELESRAERRFDVLCARVPNLTTRTQNLLDRLPGDADERGSIAWVRQRADRAREADRDELASALDNRANLLAEKLDTLPARQELLSRLGDWCADRDSAAGGPDDAAGGGSQG